MLTCRSPWRCAPTDGSKGRNSATINNTISSTGTTAALAAIASSRSVTARRSGIGGPLGNVDLQAEREERHVDAKRRHAEAHEGKRDAGERKDGEIAGDRHGELAQRQHDPRNRKPAQKCLIVGRHAPLGDDEAGLAARYATVMSNQAVQPHGRPQCDSPW